MGLWDVLKEIMKGYWWRIRGLENVEIIILLVLNKMSNSHLQNRLVSLFTYDIIKESRLKKFNKLLRRWKLEIAVCPNSIPFDTWKCTCNIGVQWLSKLFNKIFSSKIPNAWKKHHCINYWNYSSKIIYYLMIMHLRFG